MGPATFAAVNWAAHDEPLQRDPSSTLLQYVRSLHWAIATLITVGFGDIVPRRRSLSRPEPQG